MKPQHRIRVSMIHWWMIMVVMAMTAMGSVGCGGGGGDSSQANPSQPQSEMLSGVFIDSAVHGLTYVTETLHGMTDATGAFNYRDGETITFSIGDLVLGSCPAKPVITPLDLVPEADDVTHPRVTNICRLLQSLDQDGQVENGIVLSSDLAELMHQWQIDLYEDFDENPVVAGFLQSVNAAGVFARDVGLVSAQQAQRHMRQTLAAVTHPIDVSGKPYQFWSKPELSGENDPAYKDDLYAPSAVEDQDGGEEVNREIEEADIIRVDGGTLYILNAYRGLVICDISNPDDPRIVSRYPLSGDPQEMYIRNQRAYIITNIYPEPMYGIRADTDSDLLPQSPQTRVYVMAIENPSDPKLLGSSDLDGQFVDSRIVGEILYLVMSEPNWMYWGMAEPVLMEDDQDSDSSNGPDIHVVSFDVSDPAAMAEVDREQFQGSAWYIHVAESAIFVASHGDAYVNENTRITYMDISDPKGQLVRRGTINVPGVVLDEFKMDYANGQFRICTYDWENRGLSRLYIIDTQNPDDLAITGSLELGQGEQLFATRFDGNKAYLVTYERKDPLWVLDLADPANPRITGELVVPGWSTHIEPLGDRLIALGVDDADGWNVAVSLFDVADPESPQLVNRVSFGQADGWSHSSAYGDVKAFTVLEDLGLILLPYTVSANMEGQWRTDHRLQLIDLSETGLTARGWVSQKGSVLRSRSVANRLFSVSQQQIQVIDATNRDNPKVTATLSLAENITHFIPLKNEFGIRVVYDEFAGYQLNAVTLTDPEFATPVSTLDMGMDSPAALFANENRIYLITRISEVSIAGADGPYPAGGLRIQVIDYAIPSEPKKRGTMEIPGYFGYPMPLMAQGLDIMPFVDSGFIIQVKPDLLALIRQENPYIYYPYHPETDVDKGQYRANDESAEPIAPEISARTLVQIVDLSDPDHPTQVAQLPISSHTLSWFSQSDILYFSYPGGVEPDGDHSSRSRYYLGRIDLIDSREPVFLDPINIPGICVGADSVNQIIYTLDKPWNQSDIETSVVTFNSLKIQNNHAYLLHNLELDSLAQQVTIDGQRAYVEIFNWYRNNSNHLWVIDLSDPESLKSYTPSIPGNWFRIIGAKHNTVFMAIDSNLACFDATDPAKFQLVEMRNHPAYNNTMVVSDTTAYLPLGYYGLWAITDFG